MTSTSLLVLASFGLLVGPLCSEIGARFRFVHAFVDGLALAIVGGLCLIFVLPHVVADIGPVGLLLAAGGAAIPWLSHHVLRGTSWPLGVFAVALAVHVVFDGAVLALRGDHPPFAWAVVMHRLPVGFAIVVAASGVRRSTVASWTLAALMIAATVVGYVLGPTILPWLPHAALAGLEAVVAGVLLHVVFVPHRAQAEADGCNHGTAGHDHSHGRPEHGRPGAHSHGAAHTHHVHAHGHGGPRTHGSPGHSHGHAHARRHGTSSSRRAPRWAAAGTLSGLVILAAAVMFPTASALEGSVPGFVRTFGVLVLQSAPALLLGYALAGVIPLFFALSKTNALAGGGKVMQSLRGVIFGLPLPVCSCGVLPLYESLIRRGAPPIAAMAFFVATPELGLDAVLLSVPLLGGSLTVARVLSAFAVALLVALLVGGRSSGVTPKSGDLADADPVAPWSSRLWSGFRFGFVEVFDHTMPWIAVGLIVAALAEPLLSHGAIEAVPQIFQVPAAALIGVPVYVCASGATPVAALAMHKGLSAGAAVAFLIAGPATNVTTFGVLARLHGRRTALAFGGSVTVLAMLAGWIVDGIGVPAAPVLDAHAGVATHGTVLAWICAGVLMALTVASLFRQGPRGALRQILEPIHGH